MRGEARRDKKETVQREIQATGTATRQRPLVTDVLAREEPGSTCALYSAIVPKDSILWAHPTLKAKGLPERPFAYKSGSGGAICAVPTVRQRMRLK